MKRFLKTWLPTLFAGAALVLSAGHASASAATTVVKCTEVIRSVFYLPFYLGIEKGFFRDEGIEVELTTAWGSDKTIGQLVGGHVDVILLGPESAIYIQNSPSPQKAKIFASLTATDGRFLVSREPIKDFTWDMIKGKTVLGWRKGITPQLFDEEVARRHKINLNTDLKYIDNVPPSALLGAWHSGVGDFVSMFEPDVSRLEKEKKGYALPAIGNELGEIDYTVFIAMDSFIKNKPQLAQGWTNAILKAEKFIQEADPAETANIVKKYFPQIDEDIIASSIKRNRDHGLWKKDPSIRPEAIAAMQDLMIAGGTLRSEDRVSFESIVAPEFAKQAIEASAK